MVNAEKGGMKIKSGGDANSPLPNFCVLPALSSRFSVFSKLCIMNTPFHFLPLLCQSCRNLRNVSFGGYLRLDQKFLSRLAEYDDVIRGPLFSLASGPQPQTHHCLQLPSLTTAKLPHMHYNIVCDVTNGIVFILSSQWMI